MIRCIVWDFDGTLVLSNDIKRDGFLALADGVPGGWAVMEDILAAPPGDRVAIAAAFASRFGGDPADLVHRYSVWCEDQIVVCPARAGAGVVLAAAREAGLRQHINSATPTEPLLAVVLRRYGAHVFDGIRGGHGAKVANLRAIVAQEGLEAQQVAMVGDGADDRAAALEVGCRFFGVAGGTLSRQPDCGPLLSDLSDLMPMLR